MGDYVNNNKVLLQGKVDAVDAVAEIAALLGVGRRQGGDFDGQYVLSDVCVAGSINKWSRRKPVPLAKFSPLEDNDFKLAGYGLNIPSRAQGLLSEIIGVEWEYLRPSGGKTSPFRLRDFDGYSHQAIWGNKSATSKLDTIFNGRLDMVNTLLAANDVVKFFMDVADVNETGLLFPKDFEGIVGTDGMEDLTQYYLGLALIDSNNHVLIKSIDKIADYGAEDRNTMRLDFAIPTSGVSTGPAKIIPILTSKKAENWSDDAGNVITLNGAYKDITIVQYSANLTYECTIEVMASSTKVTLTIKNQTGNAIDISTMSAYLMSYGAYTNEHDGDEPYVGPDFEGEGVYPYISRNWQKGVELKQDIYSYDWNGGYSNPSDLAARYRNMLLDFKAANNGSSIIANNQTITFSYTYNAVDDGFGSYSYYPPVLALCTNEGGQLITRSLND